MPSTVQAHPRVDAAREELDAGRFEAALELYRNAAAEENNFQQQDVISLLVGQALAHMGLRDTTAMQQDMQALAAMSPGHQLGDEIPPDIRQAFEEAKEQRAGDIAVEVFEVLVRGGVELSAQPVNAPSLLVRSVGVRARKRGGEWRESWDAPLFFSDVTRGEVEYQAMLVGPGGLVLAQAYAAISTAAPAGVAEVGAQPTPVADTPQRRKWPWVLAAFLIAGAAAGAGVGIWAARREESFQLGYPMVQ